MVFVVIIILILFSQYFSRDWDSWQSPREITISRTERTAVTGTSTYGDWYVDELNFIDHDTDLTDGLKYFYSQTGIQPYVMLLEYDPALWTDGKWSETAAENYLAQVYDDTFSDNGHLIFAYFACENDSEDMDGTFYFYYGSAAYSIMDDEAETIFWSYFDMNYNNLDLSIAEFIGQTFRQTADNIMHTGSETGFSILKIVPFFIAICIVVVIIGIIVMRRVNRPEDKL